MIGLLAFICGGLIGLIVGFCLGVVSQKEVYERERLKPHE